MRTVAVVALALAIAGCAAIPSTLEGYEAKPLPASELQAARDKVHGFAVTHCGQCHIASLPTARPAALRIYNLDAAEWSSTLTAGQLRNGFPRRLNAQLDEDGKRVLRTFIEGELALR